MEGTETYVDQPEERVVYGGDKYISREKVAQGYGFLEFILRRGFRDEKGVFLRRNSLFLSTEEFPDGLRGGVSLLEHSTVNIASIKCWGVANLLEKEEGHEPGDNRESRRHGAREEIRVFLQELVVTEQVWEPFCRTRKCSSDDGSISNTQS